MYRHSYFVFIFAHENKKKPSKVDYLSETAEIFSTAKMAQSARQEQKYKIHLSFYKTWDA